MKAWRTLLNVAAMLAPPALMLAGAAEAPAILTCFVVFGWGCFQFGEIAGVRRERHAQAESPEEIILLPGRHPAQHQRDGRNGAAWRKGQP